MNDTNKQTAPERPFTSQALRNTSVVDPLDRVMTPVDCEMLFKRVVALTDGQGDTEVTVRRTWTASLRWARNRPTGMNDTIAFMLSITRVKNGTHVTTRVDTVDDATLKEAIQRLDTDARIPRSDPSHAPSDLLGPQTYVTSPIWDEATFRLTPQVLSDAARRSIGAVVADKLDAAGYLEVSAATWAIFNTKGLAAHATATGTMYTETVRNMEGTASGWVGKSHTAWTKVDPTALSAVALQKCRDSVNRVAIEPGRYTTILEPKAVALLMWSALAHMNRRTAEQGGTVFSVPGEQKSKIGLPVFDARITIISDPMDPECSYIPFDETGYPYTKVTWVEQGILKALPYDRTYARKTFGKDEALPNPRAFRMNGGDTSVEEMIASTERGIYVTHFDLLYPADSASLTGYSVTRDGTWLIERGKIVHAIKNMWMSESPMFVFNQVLQIGPAARTSGVFLQGSGGHVRSLPTQALNDGNVPIVAPTMKVKDFTFTRLSDAV